VVWRGCIDCPLCIGCRWHQSISTKSFNVANLACDVAQLQPASLVEHEEFFCVTCFVNSSKIISYIKSIWCVYRTLGGGFARIVDKCCYIWCYEARRLPCIHVKCYFVVDNSWLPGIWHSRRICSLRICGLPVVWTRARGRTLCGAWKIDIWWNKEMASGESQVSICGSEVASHAKPRAISVEKQLQYAA
jgi:hypothetical protein